MPITKNPTGRVAPRSPYTYQYVSANTAPIVLNEFVCFGTDPKQVVKYSEGAAGAVVAGWVTELQAGYTEVAGNPYPVRAWGLPNDNVTVERLTPGMVWTFEAEAPITAGKTVAPSATAGRVVASTTDAQVVGMAITDAVAAGDKIDVTITNPTATHA